MVTNTESLTVGDIILIEKFDLPNIGNDIKDIWAVYMGIDSSLDYPILVYFSRVTTQKKDFEKGGNRESHRYIDFPEEEYKKYGFSEPCLLDLNERPYKVEKDKFNKYTIVKKKRLPNDFIKRIFDVCLKEYLSPAQLRNIKNSMSQVGINYK